MTKAYAYEFPTLPILRAIALEIVGWPRPATPLGGSLRKQ